MRKVVAIDDQQRSVRERSHALSIIADTMQSMPAELLLTGGTVYTFDAKRPRASSIAIQGGRITAVGDDLDHLRGPATHEVKLEGRAVVPGFVDAHVHFGSYALGLERVNLDPAGTLEDGLAILRSASERLPGGRWLRGRGWDRNRWGRLPAAADLEYAIGHRPAALDSHDGHSVWLSPSAMRIVGLTRASQSPPGGVIERDEHGEPTGVVFENAQDLVDDKVPEPTAEELSAAISRALPIAAAAGLTGVHNLEGSDSLTAFRKLEAAGELTLRVYHGVARSQLRHAREQQLGTGAGSDWVRIGPVKLFSDGALGSRTAHLLEPYEGQTDGYRGVPTLTSDELCEAMRQAADAQLDVAVHAIGDAAVRCVLDAVEATRAEHAGFNERLVRIEHGQLVDPSDVPRFARLGVIASMQPIHAIADWRAADAHWGARSKHGYAWRDLLNAGATLAFGTDAPVEHIEPLLSLHAATTRVGPDGEPAAGWYPEQRLTLSEAVAAYTRGSATAERAADRRGLLADGYDADLVVLDPDPFDRDPDELRFARVAMTVVGGRVVFEG
jgi:predicted amidohydrolase YtcJ